jgi:hypothetical protein
VSNRRAHKQAARFQRVCAVTGRRGAFHPHHVVREQDVRVLNPHDPRNALRIAPDVHWNHHHGNERIPLLALTDENLAFAYEEFGVSAHEYLHRHYLGDDARVGRLGWQPRAMIEARARAV